MGDNYINKFEVHHEAYHRLKLIITIEYAVYIYHLTCSFFQIMLYEGLAQIVKSGKDPTNAREFAMTGFEDLVIGGAAGGIH